MNNWMLNQLNPEGLKGNIPRPPMMAQTQPQGSKDWLQALLMGATLLSGMAGGKKDTQKAPGGYQLPKKPIMAEAFHSLAQGLEKKAKGEQLMKQAEDERRVASEKEKWDRTYKQYIESEKTRRHMAGITSAEKITGMRTQPDIPTELDIQKQKMEIKRLGSVIKANNALAYKRYRDAKDPRADAYEGFDKLLKETSGNKTRAGTMLYGNAMAAWAEFEKTKNIQPLLMIQSLTQSAQLDTYEETTAPTFTTKEGKTIKMQETIRAKPAPDRGNLDRLVNEMLRRANIILSKEGGGVEGTTDLKTQVQTAFEKGDSEALDTLASKHGEAVINGILEELYGG